MLIGCVLRDRKIEMQRACVREGGSGDRGSVCMIAFVCVLVRV